MTFDLEKMFGITAATAASIQDHNATGTSPEGLDYYANEVYVPSYFNGRFSDEFPLDEDFDRAAYIAECEKLAREEQTDNAITALVAAELIGNDAVDVTDDGFGFDCGLKKERDPNLEEIDDRGWIPQMI